MRIESLHLNNYQAHRNYRLAVSPDSRVVLFCGDNGAGKSTLLEAIRFALVDDLPRDVERKADISHALMTGEKDGSVTIGVTEDGQPKTYKRSLKTGAYSGESPVTLSTTERAALLPFEFLNASTQDRRRMLFTMSGVNVGKKQVTEDLLADGFDAVRVESIVSKLSVGFDAASKEAETRASQARGAWKQITGETYGDVKGGTWKATVPDPPEREVADLNKAISDAELELGQVRNETSKLEAESRQYEATAELRETASHLQEREKEKLSAQARKVEAEQAHEEAKKALFKDGWNAACPSCGTLLESCEAGELHLYEKKSVTAKEAKAKVQATLDELAKATTAVSEATRAYDHAKAAEAALKSLPEAKPDEDRMGILRESAANLSRQLFSLRDELKTAEAYVRSKELAATSTAAALQHHSNVQAYAKLAVTLQELPIRYLNKAIGAINAELQQLTPVFGDHVQIGPDLVPLYGRYTYRQCSKSQRWRIELAIGYVLASKTHGLCLIDDFDMLAPKHRSAVIQWMMGQDKVQFIIAATMKEAPKLPEQADVRWIGD